ncbi:hypothetical protein [Sphingobacterium sp. T2]|uniref:hypothetical protein n=1 Tax=Sphingobacterium sp. T2 TaxID=1590596 RepID=UPI000689CEF6|nr:hypothetical protein [Sphingobacterium sp. T2]
MKNKNLWLYGIIAFTILFIASAVIFRVFNVEILPSQFYGALIGVVITAIITVFLLKGQTSQEMERDKDVKIFEQKIKVYSEFTERMWAMLDDGTVTDEELKELRTICFRRLVFYLNSEQINNIYEQINKIDFENDDTAMKAVGEITHILQNSLKPDENVKSSDLIKLFNSFDKKKFEEKEEPEQVVSIAENTVQQQQPTTNNVRYWHFNTLYEQQQIQAFKNGNWVLALIEYGEEWRTNAIRQVKPNDVIFLFKRGGAGYIGAFRALDPTAKILEAGNEYTETEIAKFDIYEGLKDGASLCSNILVEPIAYNFKGVGYYTVRRRTIERMNDFEAVKFLLNRFNGKDLSEDQLTGKGKLDNDTTLTLNENYFAEIIRNNNL